MNCKFQICNYFCHCVSWQNFSWLEIFKILSLRGPKPSKHQSRSRSPDLPVFQSGILHCSISNAPGDVISTFKVSRGCSTNIFTNISFFIKNIKQFLHKKKETEASTSQYIANAIFLQSSQRILRTSMSTLLPTRTATPPPSSNMTTSHPSRTSNKLQKFILWCLLRRLITNVIKDATLIYSLSTTPKGRYTHHQPLQVLLN